MSSVSDLPPIAVLPPPSASSPIPTNPTATKSKGKENSALKQSTLAAFANNASQAPKGKKRSLTLANGTSIDIQSASLPATTEVVEALRKRVMELEDELAGQPPVKKPRTSKAAVADPQPAASTSASASSSTVKAKPSAAEKKKDDAIIKKMWTRLQKEVKSEDNKFRQNGTSKTVRFEEVIEYDEFMRIFFPEGVTMRLIQPLPNNKPNSTVTIIEFGSEGIKGLFGKHYKDLKGNLYSVGGILAQFERGKKMGTCELDVSFLQVNYSKNTMKCALKFDVSNEATCYRGYGSDFW